MGTHDSVLCRFVFCGAEDDEPSSVLLPQGATVASLRHAFPFEGKYHFRLQETTSGGYVWRDLGDDAETLPSGHVLVKVLQLSSSPQAYPIYSSQIDAPEYEQFEHFFRASPVKATSKGGLNSMWKSLKASGKEQLSKTSARVWETVEFTAGRYFNSQSGDEKPSAAALQQLSAAASLSRAVFSDANRDHMDLLRRLWTSIHGDASPPAWTELGFPSDDPISVLQNSPSSVFTLHALVFFCEVHRSACLEMLPPRPAYAFAMVALHLGALIADLLDLPTGRFVERDEVYWRLFEDPIGLRELFSVSLHAYDDFHRQAQGSFQSAMEQTKAFMCQVLLRGPKTVGDLVQVAHQVRSAVLH
ncbi:hypothetical protein SDRG_16564 [Saprolegnia diclina VS20]|uniref:ELMO domain-containing protein n=1 Tax=Saprolegnia diclina (strain VS20) TaxID=1156394 RepID=T0PX02_SAPDV|nr:hypothetical protein SDRG_16564 [Saprolegnia diclina VS20]EQC25545.1 hypothetical protein SDRG_16564 [Saprolegnia diclina VS20]|eukprot:XP_008621001.1 hypothetical protein SDRG_16564 [Saprolegnia diclina VS20]